MGLRVNKDTIHTAKKKDDIGLKKIFKIKKKKIDP